MVGKGPLGDSSACDSRATAFYGGLTKKIVKSSEVSAGRGPFYAEQQQLAPYPKRRDVS